MDQCLEWGQARNADGYGIVRRGGRWQRAHRWAWEQANGPIPDGMHVLHSCDNRACVNPAHLRLGSHQENMDDVRERGKQSGARNPRAKLTEQQVAAIRSRCQSESCASLARDFGVSPDAIRLIAQGKRWITR